MRAKTPRQAELKSGIPFTPNIGGASRSGFGSTSRKNIYRGKRPAAKNTF